MTSTNCPIETIIESCFLYLLHSRSESAFIASFIVYCTCLRPQGIGGNMETLYGIYYMLGNNCDNCVK